MAIYDSTVRSLGTEIRAGLESIAKAISENKSPTYNIIVNTAATDPAEIAAAAQAALERAQARENAVGA
jgi:hypothetical protein